MISTSLPGEALAQLGQLGPLSHLYPPPPAAGMTPEFLAPPPRPYARYAPRRPRDAMPAPPAPHPPITPSFPPVPGAYAPYLHHASYASYLCRNRAPQPPMNYPLRPRPTSGFVPPAPAPHSPPVSTPAPAPPPREVSTVTLLCIIIILFKSNALVGAVIANPAKSWHMQKSLSFLPITQSRSSSTSLLLNFFCF